MKSFEVFQGSHQPLIRLFARRQVEVPGPEILILLETMIAAPRGEVLLDLLLRVEQELVLQAAIPRLAAATAALEGAYSHLREHGTTLGLETPLYDIQDMHRLMGFEDVWDFERRWR